MEKNAVEYKKLQKGDDSKFHELVLLFNEEFESSDLNDVNSESIRKLLNNPNFVCFVAYIDNRIVGGLTAYELEMYDREGSLMYLYDIAVCNEHQRQGIGSRLVKEIIEYCKASEIKELFVQADGVDQHAIQFYNKIGGTPSKTFQFSFNPLDY